MSDYLCEELIVEIFTRLPPKSLLRFRLVSKSLCSCISSPGFIRMHTFRSPQKILFRHLNNEEKNKEPKSIYTLHGEDELPLYLCPERGYIGITTSVQFPSRNSYVIIGSCNGTFCLWTEKGLTLWNPSIRRKLIVPECPRRRSERCLEGIGFGFDPISDDYKIVLISYVKDNSFVYAVKSGTWCGIASPKHQNQISHIRQYAFFNAVLHWVLHVYKTGSQGRTMSCMLTFNLSTHVFGMIPLPGPTSQWMTTGLTTIQGSLALISYGRKFNEIWIRIWREASWSVVFKLNTDQLYVIGALQLQPQLQPTNNGDLLLNTYAQGLYVYNPKTGVPSRVVDFNAASSLRNFFRFVETLHLLDMGETIGETEEL